MTTAPTTTPPTDAHEIALAMIAERGRADAEGPDRWETALRREVVAAMTTHFGRTRAEAQLDLADEMAQTTATPVEVLESLALTLRVLAANGDTEAVRRAMDDRPVAPE